MTIIKQSGAVRWALDGQGVATVILDDPGRTANMINGRHRAGLDDFLDDVSGRRDLRGVVVTSAKHSFFSGPDFVPGEITADDAAGTYDLLVPIHDQLRRLETLGRPVAAALTGSALGGGFELALACHYRAGLDAPGVVWALAETGMGLIPGGGGVVRVTRMAGVAATVFDIVGPGTAYRPAGALRAGLVDVLAPTRAEVVAAARAWVLGQSPDEPFRQRWERPGYRIPGGEPDVDDLTERVRQVTVNTPLVAPEAVLEVALRSWELAPDAAFPVETAAFRRLLHLPVTAAMSRLFFELKTVFDGGSRPAGPGAEGPGIRPYVFERRGVVALADVFFPPGSPIIEIHCADDAPDAAVAGAYDAARARGGIPVVSRGGGGPFVQALLDGGPGTGDVVRAARHSLAGGLRISAADADVAAALAAGLPAWVGGVQGG